MNDFDNCADRFICEWHFVEGEKMKIVFLKNARDLEEADRGLYVIDVKVQEVFFLR